MTFNRNTNLSGKHAFLSPSTYHWLNYDEEKLRRVYFEKQQASLGDKLHAFAAQAILLGVKQAENGTTLSTYVNDAIGFRMEPEVPLFFSEDCFGTTDAIGVRNNILRIHDLKTGVTPAKMTQLMIYTGIFFFEYGEIYKPTDLRTVLRIYQNDAIEEYEPQPSEILEVMDRIKTQARLIAYLREED
jgi:hypothetical protein